MPDPVVIAVLMGLLGLIIGSFVAAVTVRLPRDEDIMMGRSRCMSCERPLAPWHLVPVFSWLVQRGRCGWCRSPVSPRYILIELAAGGIGVWAALSGADGVMIGASAVLGWQLLLIAIVDAENFWLPDILTWPLMATGLGAAALISREWPLDSLTGLLVGFTLLWGMAWLYKRVRKRDGLGGGDPFLFAGAGAWVGWMGLPSVLLWACAVGFSLVLTFLITRGRVSGTDRLPFGSFLCVGIWLTWLYGPLGVG
ncbi:prepilin peptidase [Brevundimonas variabilis]|uniref:Prepilin leader peptidase/N-methyltransferase n=1 Tax=Brevundimonas variabilis TaxID=74312 RepID=A0A7W9FDW6_9CAUL|nr:A24 family peptidase [Brevundimonas variabilis]MBB5745645.1 leader peptidase (prepilin peptidase)/N-methyltransferase [Brevundimonas variabilis]